MNKQLDERLNAILPRLISKEFLGGHGLGNEIAFYIFDYPPEDELKVRSYLKTLLELLPKRVDGISIKHIDLFEFVLEYLEGRGLLEKSVTLQRERGDTALRSALAGPLHETRLSEEFAKLVVPDEQDLVIVSGIGKVWPLVRSHTLLNNLQSLMGSTPLVLFYPGSYDGQSLRLFRKIKNNNYYRAFRLVP
jgi:hypothetical protein